MPYVRYILCIVVLGLLAGCASSKRAFPDLPKLVWPVEAVVYSPFYNEKATGVRRIHLGVDLPAPMYTDIIAAADGTVHRADSWGNYGNIVIITHTGGWESRYAHLSGMDVEQGDEINQGDIIGRVGKTGNATGPHLHFEVRHKGVPVNPVEVIRRDMNSVSEGV